MGGLGFRDVECFNKAKFGKQCWRMLNSPIFLIAISYERQVF